MSDPQVLLQTAWFNGVHLIYFGKQGRENQHLLKKSMRVVSLKQQNDGEEFFELNKSDFLLDACAVH